MPQTDSSIIVERKTRASASKLTGFLVGPADIQVRGFAGAAVWRLRGQTSEPSAIHLPAVSTAFTSRMWSTSWPTTPTLLASAGSQSTVGGSLSRPPFSSYSGALFHLTAQTLWRHLGRMSSSLTMMTLYVLDK